MAREVSVRITANTSGFSSGMNSAASAASQTAAKIKASFDSGLNSIGKNSRSINNISSALGKVGLVAAVGFGAAVKSAANFDSAMSGVAATGADARANLTALREAAIKAGADTKFSATEAAGGLEALAKAGVSSADALGGGLSGALNLAAAGNQSVQESAETAASAMNQFGLSGKDVPHIADLLAQAAGTAQGEVSDMAAALNQSGLVANQFGLSIEESTQSLALFAKNGLVGSDAGTSFKTMLTSLYAPVGQGASALKSLGVSAYDASGAIKPIGVVADELKGKLKGLSDQERNSALKNIFGSDALRSGTILLNEGSAGLSNMATEFGKFGSAADVARTKMDNLKGDLEQLKGSFETALIGLGEGGQGPLRGLTQSLTGLVNSFNELGDGTKGAILAVGGIGAASALGVAGVLRLATGAAEAYGAFGKLATGMPRFAGALKGVGVAALAVGAALIAARAAGAGVNALIGDVGKSSEDAANALSGFAQNASLGAIGLNQFLSFKTTGDLFANGEQQIDGLGEAIKRLGDPTGFQRFNDGITGLATGITGVKGSAEILTDRFGQLDTRLGQLATTNAPAAATAFAQIAKTAADQGVPVEKLVALFPEYASAARSAAEASGGTVGNAQQLADVMSGRLPAGVQSTSAALDAAGSALASIGDTSSSAATDINSLTSAMFAAANAALATSDAQIGYEQAVDAAAEAAGKLSKKQKESGDALDVSSKRGRENKSLLNQLAAAGQKYVQSLIDQGESAKTVKAATQDARGEFIKQARAMGLSETAAGKLANQYGLVPKKIVTEVETKAAAAKAELGKVKSAIKDLPKKQQVEVLSAYKKGGIEAAQAKLKELQSTKADVKVKTSVDTTALRLAKGDLDYFGHPINATVDVKATGVGETNAQIDTTSRGRNAATRSKATGVGATNAQIDTTQRGRNATTRSKASGVGSTNSQIDTTARGRNATTRSKASGTAATNSAINNTARPRTSTITATARTAAANAALNAAARHREAVITVKTNDVTGATGGLMVGGNFAMRGPLHRSAGGPVWGAGSATSDSIPALLSNGEFVIRAKSVQAIGANRLSYMNNKGEMPTFAKGGPVGYAAGGPVGLTSDPGVLKALTAQFHVDQARNLAERRAADKELAKAMKKLNETQSAALDSIKSLSTSLQEPYRSKSTDVDDVLAALKDGAKDISAFGAQVARLKAAGLSQQIIDQITADGAINGGELAGQILAGGQGLVNSLNAANDQLVKASTALGQTAVGVAAAAPKKKALGGLLTGPGSGTSDSIPVLASNGEYIVNAAATAANRSALDAINYGRAQVTQHRFAPAYAGGGYVSAPQQVDQSYHGGPVVLQGDFGTVDRAFAVARAAQRDALTMARLTTSLA